jgi:hypothetical protein
LIGTRRFWLAKSIPPAGLRPECPLSMRLCLPARTPVSLKPRSKGAKLNKIQTYTMNIGKK